MRPVGTRPFLHLEDVCGVTAQMPRPKRMHHGPLRIEREDIVLADCDPLAPENLHVQVPVLVTGSDGSEGIGVFEQLIIGPFAPLGLDEFLDGAR